MTAEHSPGWGGGLMGHSLLLEPANKQERKAELVCEPPQGHPVGMQRSPLPTATTGESNLRVKTEVEDPDWGEEVDDAILNGAPDKLTYTTQQRRRRSWPERNRTAALELALRTPVSREKTGPLDPAASSPYG